MSGDADGRRAYVTSISSEDFLEGLYVMHASLRGVGARHPLVVFAASSLPRSALAEMERRGIAYRVVETVPPPRRYAQGPARDRAMFNKLWVFGQDDFEKVVHVDADMVVCRNIDDLFEAPHMSAVNAGGMLPEKHEWRHLNAGLMVVEPDRALFDDMVERLVDFETDGLVGDQAFLHRYYPEWPARDELHLHHTYNVFPDLADAYHERFGFRLVESIDDAPGPEAGDEVVRVLHYIGKRKPWGWIRGTRAFVRVMSGVRPQLAHALQLWLDWWDRVEKES